MRKWIKISQNEQSAPNINGRHFFACRCNPKRNWQIEELDRSEINGSRRIDIIAYDLTTKQKTAWLKRIQS